MSRIINTLLMPVVILALLAGCSRKKAPEAPDAGAAPPPQVVVEPAPIPQLAAVPIVNPQAMDPNDKRPLTERLAERKLAPGVALQMLRVAPPTQEELAAPHLRSFPDSTKRALVTYTKLLDLVPELRCCPEPAAGQKPPEDNKLIEKKMGKKVVKTPPAR